MPDGLAKSYTTNTSNQSYFLYSKISRASSATLYSHKLHNLSKVSSHTTLFRMSLKRSNKSEEASHFNQGGATYEKLAGNTSATLAAAALSTLPLPTYGADSHILDSACGPGVVTKLLLSPSPGYITVAGLPIKPSPRVTGIDIGPRHGGAVQQQQHLHLRLVEAIRPGRRGVMKPMYLDPAWETREKLEETIRAGGFPRGDRDGMEVHDVVAGWQSDSLDEVVETLSSLFWTAKIWEDWSVEEMARCKDEILRQLTEEERGMAALDMIGWICVARKP